MPVAPLPSPKFQSADCVGEVLVLVKFTQSGAQPTELSGPSVTTGAELTPITEVAVLVQPLAEMPVMV